MSSGVRATLKNGFRLEVAEQFERCCHVIPLNFLCSALVDWSPVGWPWLVRFNQILSSHVSIGRISFLLFSFSANNMRSCAVGIKTPFVGKRGTAMSGTLQREIFLFFLFFVDIFYFYIFD